MGFKIALYTSSLFSSGNCDFRPVIQYSLRSLRSSCFLFVVMCLRQVSLFANVSERFQNHIMSCQTRRAIYMKRNIEVHSCNSCCGGKAIRIIYSEFMFLDYILITNLMHWLLFIHKILFSSTCFEPQVLIFRRMQMYTCGHMVLSLSMRVPGGLSVHSLSENWL